MTTAKVPLIDPETGRFPDRFAPESVAADASAASASATAASAAASTATQKATAAESARAAAVVAQQAAEAVPAQVGTAMAAVAADPTSEFAIQQSATFAPSALARWKAKLSANAADARLVIMGDSTSEPLSTAVAIGNRLKSVHLLPTEGLAGMLPENITLAGFGGTRQDGWWATHGATVIAANPDLVVYSLGINDVRRGDTTQENLTAGIKSDVNTIRAALPNADIVLRVPNPLTSDDVNGNAWVIPNSSAQAYSTILLNTYLSLDGLWPNVVVWNAQDRIFGRISKAKDSYGGLMFDQLHPSTAGYEAIADSIVADLIGRPRRYAAAPAVTPTPLAPADMFVASRGIAPYTVADLVDRADSATTPGTATTGQPWTVSAGTMGVSSKRIYAAVNGNSRAALDSTLADGEFGVTFTVLDPVAACNALIFRHQDANNYLLVRGGHYWELQKFIAGAAISLFSGQATAHGDRVQVVCAGTSVKAYINGVLLVAATVPEFVTATQIGLQMTNTVTRAVDLYARRLPIA